MKKSENEIEKSVPSTIEPKVRKYTRINFNKRHARCMFCKLENIVERK